MNTAILNLTERLFDSKTKLYKTHQPLSTPWIIPLTLLILSSTATNLIVIITWARQPQLHTATNLNIVSLAVADGLVAVISMPINLLRMTGNQK